MELQGNILKVLPIRSGVSASSGKPWTIAEYLLGYSEDGHDHQFVFSKFLNENEPTLEVGDQIKLQFIVDSRTYKDRNGNEHYATDVRALGFEVLNKTNVADLMAPIATPVVKQQQQQPKVNPMDGLPF